MMELNAIKKVVYVPFIVQKFEEKHRRIDLNLVENVYDLFDGHTFYVQKNFNESFLITKESKVYRLTDRLFSLWIKRMHGRAYLKF